LTVYSDKIHLNFWHGWALKSSPRARWPRSSQV